MNFLISSLMLQTIKLECWQMVGLQVSLIHFIPELSTHSICRLLASHSNIRRGWKSTQWTKIQFVCQKWYCLKTVTTWGISKSTFNRKYWFTIFLATISLTLIFAYHILSPTHSHCNQRTIKRKLQSPPQTYLARASMTRGKKFYLLITGANTPKLFTSSVNP